MCISGCLQKPLGHLLGEQPQVTSPPGTLNLQGLTRPLWCCWPVKFQNTTAFPGHAHKPVKRAKQHASRTCTQTCQTRQTTTDVSDLTLDCIDDTVAIFYQLFEEFTRPLQLYFIWFESLSEVWTVQIAIAELQRRMSHLLTSLWGDFHSRNNVFWVSHAADARLPQNIHFCAFL